MADARPANSKRKTVTFELYAPEAVTVLLAGTFNRWDPVRTPLKKCEKGIWKATLELAPGRYEYRYRVDDTWQNDPSAAEFVPNAFGTWNCVIQVH